MVERAVAENVDGSVDANAVGDEDGGDVARGSKAAPLLPERTTTKMVLQTMTLEAVLMTKKRRIERREEKVVVAENASTANDEVHRIVMVAMILTMKREAMLMEVMMKAKKNKTAREDTTVNDVIVMDEDELEAEVEKAPNAKAKAQGMILMVLMAEKEKARREGSMREEGRGEDPGIAAMDPVVINVKSSK